MFKVGGRRYTGNGTYAFFQVNKGHLHLQTPPDLAACVAARCSVQLKATCRIRHQDCTVTPGASPGAHACDC